MKTVVADLDDDLAVGEIGPQERGLYLHRGLFPEVHRVSAGETGGCRVRERLGCAQGERCKMLPT